MVPRLVLTLAWLVLVTADRAQAPSSIAKLPVTSRADMIATAKRLAEHTWTCHPDNLNAPCISNYDTDWKVDQKITGLPYSWGAIDSPEEFDRKIAKGFAAGSHSRHGVASCTAGINCFGFVAYCWGGFDRTNTRHATFARSPQGPNITGIPI